MKLIVFFSALASVAVIQVTGASVYGAKDEAKIEIEKKFQETVKNAQTTMEAITAERNKDYNSLGNKAKEEKKEAVENSMKVLKEEVYKTTRSAIARGKPLAVIECIARTAVEGMKTIPQSYSDFSKDIESTAKTMREYVNLLEVEVEIIKQAAEELKNESLGFVDKETDVNKLPAIKNDAAKKAKTSADQLKAIWTRVQDIKIIVEYTKVQEQFDKKLSEIEDNLKKKLQKCIA